MDQPNNNTIARDFAFRFLFRLQTKGVDYLIEELHGDLQKRKNAINEFQIIYADKDEESKGCDLNSAALFFATKLIDGVLAQHGNLKTIVENLLNNKKIESLDKVDLTILILGGFEILNVKETPYKVAINEYIEMAKKYGRAESKSFINGILDSLHKKHA